MVLRRNYGNAYGSGVFGREMTVVGLGFVGEITDVVVCNYCVRVWDCHFWLFIAGSQKG